MSERDTWEIAALRAEVSDLRAELDAVRPRYVRYDPDRNVPTPKLPQPARKRSFADLFHAIKPIFGPLPDALRPIFSRSASGRR